MEYLTKDSMIIVNADDFGISNPVNRAIVTLFEQKFISSTTLMTNMPCVEEAVKIAEEKGFSDSVGLHFNLIEGRPLSSKILNCPRLCKNGELSYKRRTVFFFTKEEKDAIRDEFLAQLRKMRELGLEPSHIDSHQHAHTELGVYMAIRKTLKKEGIKAVRIGRNIGVGRISKLYKLCFNFLLRFDGFNTTNYFNELWKRSEIHEMGNDIEYMCHPIVVGEIIKDAFSGNVFTEEYKINSIDNYRAL